MTKKLNLDEIEARAKAAPPGPYRLEDWLEQPEECVYVQSDTLGTVAQCRNLQDARFMSEAITDIPALIAALRSAGAEVKRLQKLLEKI